MDAYETIMNNRKVPRYDDMGPEMTHMAGDQVVPPVQHLKAAIAQAVGAPMAIDRAVAKSPPPLDDVGGCDPLDFDEKDPHRPTDVLLADRHKTHGSFMQNARHGQHLRDYFRGTPGWRAASVREREALDYLAGKLSRILSGQPGYADHWHDIAGYAELAASSDLQR